MQNKKPIPVTGTGLPAVPPWLAFSPPHKPRFYWLFKRSSRRLPSAFKKRSLPVRSSSGSLRGIPFLTTLVHSRIMQLIAIVYQLYFILSMLYDTPLH